MRIQSTKLPQAPKPAPSCDHKTEDHGKIRTFADTCMLQVAKPSEAVDKNPILGAAFTAVGSLARSTRALPDIIYPTIYEATGAEKAQIMQTLDSLPLHHVSEVRSIRMVPEIPTNKPNWSVNGRAHDLTVTNRIQLSRTNLNTPEKLNRTLIHEIGHAVDYESKAFEHFHSHSTREPFGEGPHITDYAKTNHREDFAESYEEFFVDRENLNAKVPEKHDAVQDIAEPGLLESLVDRKEFRETGKYMADAFGDSEISRHAAQGAYFAGAGLQVLHGVSQWTRSAQSGDSVGHAAGILNTATGLAFLSGANPLIGMGFQGANHALQSAVRRDKLGAEEVAATVSVPVRPLEKIFGRDTTTLEDGHRPGKVLGVAAGGAIGGTIGSLVGPYAGVIGGYHIAGGLGGTIGLVAGGMLGFLAGAEIGGRVGGKLAGL